MTAPGFMRTVRSVSLGLLSVSLWGCAEVNSFLRSTSEALDSPSAQALGVAYRAANAKGEYAGTSQPAAQTGNRASVTAGSTRTCGPRYGGLYASACDYHDGINVRDMSGSGASNANTATPSTTYRSSGSGGSVRGVR